MRICLLNHSYPPTIGGGESHVYYLAGQIGRLGHEVMVLAGLSDDGELSDQYNVELRRVAGLREFESGETSFRSALPPVHQALKDEVFDVVHIHNIMPALLYSPLRKVISTKKVVLTFHSTPVPSEQKILGHFNSYRIEEMFIRHVISLYQNDSFVFLSEYIAETYRNLGAKQCHTVYPGVPSINLISERVSDWRKKYGYDASDFIVLLATRSIPRKRILEVIKAIDLIKSKSVKLHIATSTKNSSTGYLAEVRKIIREKELQGKVTLVVDTEDVTTMPIALHASNLCVLPSKTEGLGIILVEALAAGTPILASNSHGINEVVTDGWSGKLIDCTNPCEIADGIRWLVNSTRNTKIMSNNGLAIFQENFDVVSQTDKIIRLYESEN